MNSTFLLVLLAMLPSTPKIKRKLITVTVLILKFLIYILIDVVRCIGEISLPDLAEFIDNQY